MTEVLRSFRYFNVLIGLSLTILPWFIQDVNLALALNCSLTGLLVMALSFSKWELKENYGLWDKFVV